MYKAHELITIRSDTEELHERFKYDFYVQSKHFCLTTHIEVH